MCVLCMYRVSELGIILYSVLYTEYVARGGKLSFQNVHGGGEGVYDILTFQKSRGALDCGALQDRALSGSARTWRDERGARYAALISAAVVCLLHSF